MVSDTLALTSIRIGFLLLVFCGFFLLSCDADISPGMPPITDISTPTSEDAWIVTNHNELIHLKKPKQVRKIPAFDGRAKLVSFTNKSSGWVVDTGGKVWHTTDGDEWFETGDLGNGYTAEHATNLAFATDKIGWITTPFGLWQTIDGGGKWTKVDFGSIDAQPVDFVPVDGETGWLLFTNAKLGRTIDRGNTWSIFDLGGTFTIRGFYSNGHLNNWVGAADGRPLGLFHSDSPGEWKQVLPEANTRDIGIQSISFASDQIGWLCGQRFASLVPEQKSVGVIMRTNDGGLNWLASPSALPDERFVHIRFFDESNGWIVSNRRVYYTANGGVEWVEIPWH